MSRDRFERWVAAYERAWRTPGTDAIAELFAPEATYRTSPFAEAHVGTGAIAAMWERERTSADEVFALESEVVAAEGDTAVVRLEVTYGDPTSQVYRDLWIVTLDGDGRCVGFEEWPFWPPGTSGEVAAGPAG